MININHFFNALIKNCIDNNCSDLHLDLIDDKCYISVRYLGKMQNIKEIDYQTSKKLFNFIIYYAKFDIIDSLALQTNTLKYHYKDYDYYLRISVVYTNTSKSIVIRVINNHQIHQLQQLSILKNNTKQLEKLLTYKSGLIILSGKTGSGKTTTLYALLEKFKQDKNIKIITLEDPIEKQISDIFQININSETYSYFDVLKQVLRHDPDIIVIGEIRDANDLKLTIQAALSGHLVITTMHALSALFTLNRLLELQASSMDLKACLKVIVYQELFYLENHQAFSLYEFIEDYHINEYLTNKKTNYFKISDCKNYLNQQGVKYFEGK